MVIVVGAGLAGTEAAWQLAQRGLKVKLYEMRPKKMTEVHTTPFFAELVCSNSLRSNSLENAVGILKEELRLNSSLIMSVADEYKVPAGTALAVDRDGFAEEVTKRIMNHPNIEVINEEVSKIPDGFVIIATGPLTTSKLSESIKEYIGEDSLSFYDAVAPIVSFDSIDMTKAYYKDRYGDSEDYINCPLTKEEFKKFHRELIMAETVKLKDFEVKVFEGCMPFEVMAKRGEKTLLFGPMKPVGLETTEHKPYAVVQLRQDNAAKSLYNVVGFQTNLKFHEQKRILNLVPALRNVEIVRYGVMHKNTFINSPKVLRNTYQTIKNDKLFFAGQITGVEGYIESVASGLIAGINMARLVSGQKLLELSSKTIMGSQANYISNRTISNFQPMNANFGLLASLGKHNKSERKVLYGQRALEAIKDEFN